MSTMAEKRIILLIVTALVFSVSCEIERQYSYVHLIEDLSFALRALRPTEEVIRSTKSIAPDLFMDLKEFVGKWGYPLERHAVRTEDDYILTLHRIPRGRRHPSSSRSRSNATRPPALLQHGLMGCADLWVLGGLGIAPAFTLADEGYDVWLANARGSQYSRSHKTLRPEDPRFWNFTWHEIGFYDVPAVIDYVLNATEQEQLFYMGHSMGSLVLSVATSLRPEYNAKIRLQVALAPGVFLDQSPSYALKAVVDNGDYLYAALSLFPTLEFPRKTRSWVAVIHQVCGDRSFFNKFCAVGYSSFVGTMDLNNATGLSKMFARGFSSTSYLVLDHYRQLIASGDVKQYDRGVVHNMKAFKSPKPPKYPLKKVTPVTAIYGARSDFLATPQGVERLSRTLPNVISTHIIEEKFFNHLDFYSHPKVNELFMEHVIQTMKQFL